MSTIAPSTYRLPLLGMLLSCGILACGDGSTVKKPVNDAVLGTWKVAGTDVGPTAAKRGSVFAGLVLMFQADHGASRHVITSTDYIVNGPAGDQVHRWLYRSEDTLMVIGSDTATIRWANDDAFTLASHGVSLHYERAPEGGH